MLTSDDKQARRRRHIDQARANVRLSGTILPAGIEEINRRYVEGQISADQHLSLCLAYADAITYGSRMIGSHGAEGRAEVAGE